MGCETSMPSQHIIDIIIKAEDLASQQAEKVNAKFKGLGDTAKKANETASQSSEKAKTSLEKQGRQMEKVVDDYMKVGTEGEKSFNKLTKSQQEAVLKFHQLSEEAQVALISAREVGESLGTIGKGWALNQFKEVTYDTKTWAGSLDMAKAKMDLLGKNTNTLGGKIQTTGMAIQTYLGSKWDSVRSKIDGIKTKVTALGSTIKNGLSNAISNVSNRLQSLGQAFDGIGGLITQSLGVIGVNSIKEMTLEASISRDRIFNLSYALMGAGQSAEQFKSDANSLWNIMDAGTNNSLVGLDQLSQAMSVIKLSTGATTEQLKAIEPTILDIGQRAILMGKSGDEAIGLMEAAGKGLNGEFEMLKENLGISKDKLIDAGWTGAADDIDGYTQALSKCLSESGDVSDMMDTTYGKLTSLQKFWKLAGRSLGDDFLPYIDMALDKFMAFADADSDGALDKGAKELMKYAVGAGAVVSAFASLAPTITPMFATLRELQSLLKGTAVFLGIMEGEENALTLATIRESAAQKISAATKWLANTATSAYALIVGVLTGEITLATAAQTMWNAVMAANPIGLVVVALAALAVAVYEVGKSFGWWSDVGTMIEAVQAGLQRLWNAFINNPNVQGFLQDLSNAWNDVCNALAPVIDWAGKVWNELFPPNASGEVDVVRMIIDAFGAVGDIMGKIVNGAKSAWSALNQFSGVAAVILGPAAIIYGALRSIVCILLGCSPGIVPALQKVQEVFLSVWSWISSFIGGIISNVVAGIQPILDILSDIGNFLLTSFQFAWQTIVSVFGIILGHVNLIITVFNQLLSGQISLSSALTMIWTTISSMFFSVLGTIIFNVTSFAQNLVQKGLTAGRGFVNGVISFVKTLPVKVKLYLMTVLNYILTLGSKWVSTAKTKAKAMVTGTINFIRNLPGRVFSILLQVASRIISAGSQWASNAKNAASRIVNGVKNNITSLPGIVATEFSQIGSRMMSAGSALYNKAANIGRGIVNSLKNAMGIHSPGIIQKAVVGEFEDTISRIESLAHSAENAAGRVGTNMVSGFEDTSLTEQIYPTAPSIKLEKGNDTVNLNATFTFTHEFNNLPETISAEEVASMINMAPYSKEFVKSLTQNEAFQAADLKVKNKISARNRRARGA